MGSAVADGVTHHFLVMEYVEGQTLRGLLTELGRVPEELCRHIGREITKGLEAIHAAGAVHRDLKPENVLITEDQVVKVMDLGVAKTAGRGDQAVADRARSWGRCSTRRRISFAAKRPTRARTSTRLVSCSTSLRRGVHPFQADTFADVFRRQLEEVARPAAELNPQLSPFFEEVCKALLQKDRERRIAFLPFDEESIMVAGTGAGHPAGDEAAAATHPHPQGNGALRTGG